MTRVCVITPFHTEPPAILARCIDSVAAQTQQCDHLLVGDGARLPDDLARRVRQLTLDRAHGDYGNTPRGVGALLAAAEAYDAIAFLDADNWYDPDHIEACLAAAGPATDAVLAGWRLFAEDGTALDVRGEPLAQHCDTNCFVFLPGAFSMLPVWALIPSFLSDQGDRIFYHQLKSFGLELRQMDRPTVNYVTRAPEIYRAAGLPPPADPRVLDFHRGQRILRDAGPRARQLARRRMAGFGIDPPLAGLDAAAAPATGQSETPAPEQRGPGAALVAVAARQGAGVAGVAALRLAPLLADKEVRNAALDQFRRLGGEARLRMTSRPRLPDALPLLSDGSPRGDAVVALVLAMTLRGLGAIETGDAAIATLARRMGLDVAGPRQLAAPRVQPLQDAGRFPRPATPPDPVRLPDVPRLILCAPPRTGSETLCDLLQSAGLGNPREYLNPWASPFGPASERPDLAEIGRHLADRIAETSVNGLFAIKLQGWQIDRYLKNDLGAALFDGARVVYLMRGDIRSQVESQAAAKLTGAWFRDRHDMSQIDEAQIAASYEAAIGFIGHEYEFFTEFFARTGIVPEVVTSEQLFSDPRAVLQRISACVGRPLPANLMLEAAVKKYPSQEILRTALARYAERHAFGGFFTKNPPR